MAVYTVNNQSQLSAATLKVRGGDTILLKSGTYAKLEFNSLSSQHKHIKFDKPVTIASAEAAKPAVVKEMYLNGVKNLTLRDLAFDHTGKKEVPFVIARSEMVTIKDSAFDGHLSSSRLGDGVGLRIYDSSDISVSGNRIADFYNGINVSSSKELVFKGNALTGIRNDGMAFGGVQEVEILKNSFKDFKSPSSLKHKDGIQFRAGPQEGTSSDVIIRGNKFVDDEVRHGIFIGNEFATKSGDSTKPYRDFLIENNQITGGHAHGIGVAHINGLVIRDNVIAQHADLNPKAMVTVPIISVGKSSINVSITGNKAPSVPSAASKSWTIEDNQTSGTKYRHWEGSGKEKKLIGGPSELFKNWTKDGSTVLAAKELQSSQASASGNGVSDKLSVTGSKAEGDRKIVVKEMDFSEGDFFIFRDYDHGTFRAKPGGNVVHASSNGVYAKLDSLLDFQEIAWKSSKVAAVVKGDDLYFKVEHGKGFDEVIFKGLGDGYLAADMPGLF